VSARYLARGRRLAARTLGGEKVILSADDSRLFVLNEVGAAIWDAADGRTPLAAIVEQAVCAQFDVDAETAQRDAEEFVAALVEQKLLLSSEEPLETPGDTL
jgi:hypothetical protein